MSMISSSGGRNRSFCRSSRGLDIVRLHLGKPRPENHEPAKTGIPKRKKAGLDTRLSCKTDYFITADQLDVSAASGFFTGDLASSNSKSKKEETSRSPPGEILQIGRASGRERVCQSV